MHVHRYQVYMVHILRQLNSCSFILAHMIQFHIWRGKCERRTVADGEVSSAVGRDTATRDASAPKHAWIVQGGFLLHAKILRRSWMQDRWSQIKEGLQGWALIIGTFFCWFSLCNVPFQHSLSPTFSYSFLALIGSRARAALGIVHEIQPLGIFRQGPLSVILCHWRNVLMARKLT